MAQSEAHTSTVFVSRFNRVLAIVIWALTAILLVTTFAAGADNRALALLPAVFVGLFAWTALWRPYVRINDTGVRVRNVLSTVTIPWAALIHVDTRYALTLYTPGRRFSAWAAPAPGRTGTAVARRAENHGRVGAAPTVGGKVQPGDLLASESGQAAYMVRERWNALRDAGKVEAGVADETRVPRHVHWWLNLALIALAAGAIWALTQL